MKKASFLRKQLAFTNRDSNTFIGGLSSKYFFQKKSKKSIDKFDVCRYYVGVVSES